MTNRLSVLFAVLMAFVFTAPLALAAPPEGDEKAAVETDAKTDDAKAEAPDAKAEEKADAKGDDKAEGTTGDGDGDEAKEESIGDAVDAAVEAARSGEWALMVSALIMLVIGVSRKFKLTDKLPNKALPWAAAVLGVVAAVGDALATGGDITLERVLAGVMAGAAASGLWGMIGKHLPLVGSKS